MARTAAARLHYVLINEDVQGYNCDGTRTVFRDYTVEVRQGQVRRTVGRVSVSVRRSARGNESGASWNALHVRASWGEVHGPAWTRRHSTREAAVRAMLLGEDWRYEHTHVDRAMSRAAWAMAAARLGLTVPGVRYLPPRGGVVRPLALVA